MSLAIGEHLISGDEWNRECLAGRFVEVFARDPRNGYSKFLQGLLEDISREASWNNERRSSEFLARIGDGISYRNGAAMRAVPLGVLGDVPDLIAKCRIQAKITHRTPEGADSAIAVALLVHYLEPVRDL